jgi:Protein of unknown function (DUF5672)
MILDILRSLTRLLVRPYTPKRPPSRTAAIVVPLSTRAELSPDEQVSMRHLMRFLGSDNYDRYLIAPKGLPVHFDGFRVKYFSTKFFGSAAAFNRLAYTPAFYEAFTDYRFVFIYHLDSLVFSDQLKDWCERDFDYIGPPWIRCNDSPWVKKPRVGNGGFTLMKVESVLKVLYNRYRAEPLRYWEDRFAGLLKTMQAVLRRPRRLAPNWLRGPITQPFRKSLQRMDDVEVYGRANDVFWSFRAVKYLPDFKIPGWRTGLRFAFEAAPRHCFELNGSKLPFGCHAWTRYDRSFWEPHLLTSECSKGEPRQQHASPTDL